MSRELSGARRQEHDVGMERPRTEDESSAPASSSTLAKAFELHFDAIYRYAYRRASASVAEEVASETFARAVARAATFDPTMGSYRQWLFGIATNVIREYERARLRQIRQRWRPIRGVNRRRA